MYSLNGGTPQSSNTFVVPAGTHTVVVTDANGCQKTKVKTVSQPSPVVISVTINSQIACNGGTATVTTTATGGTYPYTFSMIQNPAKCHGTYTLPAGTYTFVATDANGCTDSITITITEPDPLVTTLVLTSPILCNGSGNAVVTATTIGGTAPYTYKVDGVTDNDNVFSMTPGTHTVLTTDAHGCTTTNTITVTQPAPLVLSFTENNPVCSNGTATLTLIATGGTPAYTYQLNGVNQVTNILNLASGTYTLGVRDANGCSDQITISVNCSPTCQYRTQTMGGWGANPSGNNPAVYLHSHFASAFPNGLTIGCNNKLKLTSAQAVTNFLPSGSTAALLPSGTLTNPGGSYSNVLAGQLVAATISVKFDLTDPNFGPEPGNLANLHIASGTFAGWTVAQVLDSANKFIGGCGSHYNTSQYNTVLTAINENFVDGTTNNGFLLCDNLGITIISNKSQKNALANLSEATTDENCTIFIPVSVEGTSLNSTLSLDINYNNSKLTFQGIRDAEGITTSQVNNDNQSLSVLSFTTNTDGMSAGKHLIYIAFTSADNSINSDDIEVVLAYINGDASNGVVKGTISCEVPAGIGQQEVVNAQDEKPSVYPVPVSDVLNVDLKQGISLVEIFDVKGKLIYRTETDRQEHVSVDFSNYPAGIYHVKINNLHVVRIVK